jgi:hypothetical protein
MARGRTRPPAFQGCRFTDVGNKIRRPYKRTGDIAYRRKVRRFPRAATLPNSTGSTNSSGGKIESHNVGWSFTVLSTMASDPFYPKGSEALRPSRYTPLRDCPDFFRSK